MMAKTIIKAGVECGKGVLKSGAVFAVGMVMYDITMSTGKAVIKGVKNKVEAKKEESK